ncbi:MAG: hypothetical protein AB9882_05440 [Ignavibacteriaceae bacterium]
MAKKIVFLVPLIFLLLTFRANPQISTFSLKIFDNITNIDFGNLAFINGLASTQSIFYVEMLPHGNPVRIQGKIEWQRTIDARNRELFVNFRTNPFNSRNFYNTDLGGSDIQMDYYNVTQSVISDLIALGRPSGIFWITLELTGPENTVVIAGPVVERIIFLNPAQSIMVTNPVEGGIEGEWNTLVNWTQVTGAASYTIKVNDKKGPNQSPEEALAQGNPILELTIPASGLSTPSVTLTPDMLNRPWAAGDEVVLQVSAYVEGPGGGNTLYSNIVSFFIESGNTVTPTSVQNTLIVLLNSLQSESLAGDLAKRLLSGEIQLTGTIMLDGQPITLQQLMELLQQLINSGSILGITTP